MVTKQRAINYEAHYLSWARSYAQGEKELRELILANPADVRLLKKEYYELTGKRFRRRKGE